MTNKKKLIEVALPLDAINKASAREKSIRHGHPSTLHLWWARRPLAGIQKAKPEWKPDVGMPENPRWLSPLLYGLKTYGDLFTPRQLVALTTFSDLVGEAMELVKRDALASRTSSPQRGISANLSTHGHKYNHVVSFISVGTEMSGDHWLRQIPLSWPTTHLPSLDGRG